MKFSNRIYSIFVTFVIIYLFGSQQCSRVDDLLKVDCSLHDSGRHWTSFPFLFELPEMLGRVSSIPHPGLQQSRYCSVRIPKIVYQPRVHQGANTGCEGDHAQHSSAPKAPIGTATYPASEKPNDRNATPSRIPTLVAKPRTVGLSSSSGGMDTSSNPYNRQRAEYAPLDYTAAVRASLRYASAPVAQIQAHTPDNLLKAGGISAQAVGMDKKKYLPKADTENPPGGHACFMYRIEKAGDHATIMNNFVFACSNHANDCEMLDLTLRRLTDVQSSVNLWENPSFNQFCDTMASGGVLNAIPPLKLINVCYSLFTVGALRHPTLASELTTVALRHLRSSGQHSVCRYLTVFSHPTVDLPRKTRSRALQALADEVKMRAGKGVFTLSDGGRDYVAVVKFLIVPCVLTDDAFLREFLGLLLRSSDQLRPVQTTALVELLHQVATSFSDQALAIIAGAMARRAADETWQPTLRALEACNVAVPSVAITLEALHAATGPGQLVQLLVEQRSRALSVADARHVLLAMRPHLEAVGADDVAHIRAFLASTPDYACLYDVLACVFLEGADTVSAPATLAFLRLFADCVEFERVVAAGRVHFVAAMESLSDDAALEHFDLFCSAGQWSAATVRHVCAAVSRSTISLSGDDGECFITNMASIRCTDAALMEKLVSEYVLPRATLSKKISAPLLRAMATLNVAAAQEVFDQFESGDIELLLPAGTDMTAELALSLLVSCQLYDVHPQSLVDFFVSHLGDGSNAVEDYGADLGDAASVVLGLQHRDKISVDSSAAVFEKLARFYPSFEREFVRYMAEPSQEVSLVRRVLQSHLTDEAFVNIESFSRCGDFFAAALLYDQREMKFLPCQHKGVMNPTSLLERNTTSVSNIRHVAVIVDQANAVARNSSHMLGRQALLHQRLERLGWSVIRVKAWQCVGEFQVNQVLSSLLGKFIAVSYRHSATAHTVHVEHDAQRQQPLVPISCSQNDGLHRPSLADMSRRDLRIASRTVKESRFVNLTKHLLQVSLRSSWQG